MKFAIIAAGEGSRLAQEGVEEPKPLVSVCDQPMIERLMRIFVDCGASEIVVIINEQSTSVHRYLKKLDLPVPLKIIVKTTPSSMHSLHALSPYLRGERFCLTTVDTIFREEEFKKYIRHFERVKDIDGCMAVTPYVDDEKPLWVGGEGADRRRGGEPHRPAGIPMQAAYHRFPRPVRGRRPSDFWWHLLSGRQGPRCARSLYGAGHEPNAQLPAPACG